MADRERVGAIDGDKVIEWLKITTSEPLRDLWAEVSVLKSLIEKGRFSLPLVKALRHLERDPHNWSTRPCETCQRITDVLGVKFGCLSCTEAGSFMDLIKSPIPEEARKEKP